MVRRASGWVNDSYCAILQSQSDARRSAQPMDWNIIEGKWKELKGRAREQWGDLTDDEAHRRADEWAEQQDEADKI